MLPQPRNRFSALLAILLRLLLVILALCLPLGLESLRPEAARITVSEITIQVAPGDGAILGRAELAAPQSEWAHVRVRRDTQGRWWLANVSQARAVEVRRHGEDESLRSLTLVTGQRVWLAGKAFRGEATEPRLRVGDDTGRGWWSDGADTATLS